MDMFDEWDDYKTLVHGLTNQEQFSNVLRSIKNVGITENGRLLIGHNELQAQESGGYYFSKVGKPKLKAEAQKNGASKFVFDDGSFVMATRDGLAVLRSSDESISTIYVPLVTNSFIPLATPSFIVNCHDKRLLKRGVDVSLHQPIDKSDTRYQRLASVAAQARPKNDDFRSDLPKIIFKKLPPWAVERLETSGITGLEFTEYKSDLQELQAHDFDAQFLEPFIRTILQHGT
jgi:hypothetical protein